ncbi:S41 family peptidase [Novosphingobium sp. NDB2Meth1]|uniref:S41 family peptidase n=1 Tax=Novosphingobium sp. NDB2Meth1 TaxID=1892847 RepID=UPI0009308649|nr:S41 family peptidase [Novosphingobium sp. NDB2Meth1]
MRRALLATTALIAAITGISGGAAAAEGREPPRLLQHPSLSATEIAFDYAGAIWTVPRGGGAARVIATGQGDNSGPVFSPDGTMIAFTGRYDGNRDVYVVPASGGVPRRLTWHPGPDVVLGWSPDGKSVLFRSSRETVRDLMRFYLVPVEGGDPRPVPLPSGDTGALSGDGSHIAYTPFNQWQPAWKQYRGGQTDRIWIADLKDSSVVKIPRGNSNDRNPMFVGSDVYFLSDRDGPRTLYRYSAKEGTVSQVIRNDRGFDMASASAGPGGIVIDHFGKIEVYDLASGTVSRPAITIGAEAPSVRPHIKDLEAGDIAAAVLTPSGKRMLVEAHGEILSVPAEKGDTRNLTQTTGVAERDPAASPDGKSVAYFSDESGEYALHIRAADGTGAVRKIDLGTPGSYFYTPLWSPDSKRIVFHDKRLNLWLVDVTAAAPKPVKIATDRYDSPDFNFDPAWSPDSRYLAYAVQGANHLHTIMIHTVATGMSQALTDGMSDAVSPRFDAGGEVLYFIANTSRGLGAGWLDMSSLGRATEGAVYAAVLRKDGAAPTAPQSDEEGAGDSKDGAKDSAKADAGMGKGKSKDDAKAAKAPKPVQIDFAGLDQRIVALGLPVAPYVGLLAGEAGAVLAVTAPVVFTDRDLTDESGAPVPVSVVRYDAKARKPATLIEGADAGSVSVSADGKKILFAKRGERFLVSSEAPADASAKPAPAAVKFAAAIPVDPMAEWRQMYREVWRVQRDFLYDPKAHGLDLAKAAKLYEPFLAGLGSRGELNALFEEMTGHIGLGHTFVNGGEGPKQSTVSTGLLGADFELANGHYRFRNVLKGESWNPQLQAPLAQPGAEVKAGEYLLAINGRPVDTGFEVYKGFEGLAGKQTVLTVGPTPDGKGSRDVKVVPIARDIPLRLHSWMEANRRQVDQLSGGKLGYVYLPDTAGGGFANFNRYYFAQVGKQGMIIDERFNHGGDIADFIVDQLKRTPQMVNSTREGEPMVEPAQAIFGPKVMLINQMSGSGGDALPWLFRKAGVGTLVGTRTWGGLVGIGLYPTLMDGGVVTAPRWAIYGTAGQWEVENIGIPPDVEVEQDPAQVRLGHDPQLEAGVRIALDALAKSPPPTFVQPPAPDKKPVLPDTID